MTPSVRMAKYAASVINTGVVHIELQISPRFFEKKLNDPNVIFRARGKMIQEKNPEAKNLVTLSL